MGQILYESQTHRDLGGGNSKYKGPKMGWTWQDEPGELQKQEKKMWLKHKGGGTTVGSEVVEMRVGANL